MMYKEIDFLTIYFYVLLIWFKLILYHTVCSDLFIIEIIQIIIKYLNVINWFYILSCFNV